MNKKILFLIICPLVVIIAGVLVWQLWPKNNGVLKIGDSYQGGIVAYILQEGDAGYDSSVQHGLIAAPSDQSTEAEWGCYETEISGADGTAIGTGLQNTHDIMADCSELGIAARICHDLSLNGYTDWYLPSINELNQLSENSVAIGGFATNYHWSSSENDASNAWVQYFYDGIQYTNGKSNATYVRAIRAF